MEDERDKTIQKQSYAIACLTLLVVVLLGLVVFLAFYRKNTEQGVCGVKEPTPVCGNAIMEQENFKEAARMGFTGDASRGKTIFKENCAVCHSLSDQRLTGPGLKGVADRVPQPTEEYLVRYILNSEKLVKAHDPYALKMQHDYAPVVMTIFDSVLTEKDVRDVIAFTVANSY